MTGKLLVTTIIIYTLLFVMSCSDTTEPDDRVARPTFAPGAGSYSSPQEVTISCATDGATIRYTKDGSEPNEESFLYTSPIKVKMTTLIKARAYKQGLKESNTASAEYLIDIEFKPELIHVEGGSFIPSEYENYYVRLSSFYIGKYPVTQAEFQSVMGMNSSYFGGRADNPVEMVNWFDAIEFCNRFSIYEGLTPCYSYSDYQDYGTDPDDWPDNWNTDRDNHKNISCDWSADGYRLPTEMEWMFAAIGGNKSKGYEFSGSDDVDEVAWYLDNSDTGQGASTHPVGLKQPNELGTYDMSGNVWEWNWDMYATTYPVGDFEDPVGPESGSTRLRRGGSWRHNMVGCYVSFRNNSFPSYRSNYIGFRAARSSQ